jgi:hypothetical protein
MRSTVIGAIVVVMLAGRSGANAVPRANPPVGGVPAPFGTGNDPERAQKLATAILRQRLDERSTTCEACLYAPRSVRKNKRVPRDLFVVVSEAVSSTRTHLLVQFDGPLLHPDRTLIRRVEIRVLIALKAHNVLKLDQYREHTLAAHAPQEQP